MSINKPEINYDTALYALQENVVLKQRLEEHNLIVEKINSNHSSQMICEEMKRRVLQSNKELYQRRVEKQYTEIQILQGRIYTLHKYVGAFMTLSALSVLSLILITVFNGSK